MNLRRDYAFDRDDTYGFRAFFDMKRRNMEHAKTRDFLRTLKWTDEEMVAFQSRVWTINNRCDAYLTGRGK